MLNFLKKQVYNYKIYDNKIALKYNFSNLRTFY